jgi:hypothetical protein
VLEVASNDGYLLQFVREQGIRCIGIEPTLSTARVARERGEVKAQVARAYELVLGRPPSPATLERLVVFTREQGLPATCRALFNLNEFAFVD